MIAMLNVSKSQAERRCHAIASAPLLQDERGLQQSFLGMSDNQNVTKRAILDPVTDPVKSSKSTHYMVMKSSDKA